MLAATAVMRTSYQVGGSATCSGAVSKPASPAARTWLTRLRSVAAQQDYFVTPYADVDMSALTHAAMNTDLKRAQAKGYTIARQYLGGTQRPAAPGSGAIAWPAGGVADYGVLGNLGADGWRTVILDSSLMPPRTATLFTPSAITSALDGVDGRLNVALSDSTLSQVLAGGPTAAQARARRGTVRRPPVRRDRAGRRGRGLVRDRAALPGRDGHDRRGAARHPPFRGDHPAPPVEPRARPGHRPAGRE